ERAVARTTADRPHQARLRLPDAPQGRMAEGAAGARQLRAQLLRLHPRRQAPGDDLDDIAHAGADVRDGALSRGRKRLPDGARDAARAQAARRAQYADAALMRRARVLAVAVLVLAAGPAAAWSNHALGTWPALAAMPALRDLPPVRVESLATFIASDRAGLAAVLARE